MILTITAVASLAKTGIPSKDEAGLDQESAPTSDAESD